VGGTTVLAVVALHRDGLAPCHVTRVAGVEAMAVHVVTATRATAASLGLRATAHGTEGFDKGTGSCDNMHGLRWPPCGIQ